jgi:hypothetical protein
MTSASVFEHLSSHGIINGCIGAIDGLLCRIRVPSANEVTRVKSYFSGHYKCYGVNVQATCDGHSQFTSLSVICPGGTSDSKSFYAPNIYNTISQLPATMLIIEAVFCLHNHCIDNNECAAMIISTCDPESVVPSYVECLDPLGDAVEGSKKRQHAVCEALVELIKSDGRVRPRYNLIRNSL